jgi:AraC-like DNA-binding protein
MGTVELAFVGLAGSGIGAALGLPMVWPFSRRPADMRLIGTGLLGLSVVSAIISARVIGMLPATPEVNHVLNLVGLVCYPCIYLYVRQDGGRPLRAGDGWALWIPAAVYLSVWIARAAAGDDTRVPFQWLLPVMLSFTAYCASAADWRLTRRTSLVPGAWIVMFLAILNLSQIVRMVFGRVPLVPAIVPAVVTGGFVALVAYVVWRSAESRSTECSVEDDARSREARYAKSGMHAPVAELLLARINQALETNRLFADPSLTLSRLAREVDSTPHQVSEVLNRFGSVTFNELLNRRRVADVKAQLLDPANDRFTIEGIGASAGFGSRSALYAAFRRSERMTPKELREGRRT